MERILFAITLFISFLNFNTTSRAKELGDVTFINNSEKLLKCSQLKDKKFIPFLRLQPNGLKRFNGYEIGSEVRCSTEVVKKKSSTILTYFTVDTAGTYELLQANVPCESCTRKFRLATVVVFPNGDSDYSFKDR
jgi:hypothetical protein